VSLAHAEPLVALHDLIAWASRRGVQVAFVWPDELELAPRERPEWRWVWVPSDATSLVRVGTPPPDESGVSPVVLVHEGARRAALLSPMRAEWLLATLRQAYKLAASGTVTTLSKSSGPAHASGPGASGRGRHSSSGDLDNSAPECRKRPCGQTLTVAALAASLARGGRGVKGAEDVVRVRVKGPGNFSHEYMLCPRCGSRRTKLVATAAGGFACRPCAKVRYHSEGCLRRPEAHLGRIGTLLAKAQDTEDRRVRARRLARAAVAFETWRGHQLREAQQANDARLSALRASGLAAKGERRWESGLL
jgi:hypothetical protein